MKILRNLLIAFVSLGLTGGLIPLGGSSLAVAPQGLAEPLIGSVFSSYTMLSGDGLMLQLI